jgi:surface antigen
VAWNNPSTGYRYSVTPIRTWQTSNTTYCREFTTTGVIGGRQQQLYGTACRQPDGSWETQ